MRRDEVSERMKALMSDYDRRHFELPPDVDTAKPKKDILTQAEKRDHIDLLHFCSLHDLFKVHSRMDMSTRNEKGIPDFVIGIGGRLIAIEFKQPGRHLTQEQEEHRRKCVGPSQCEYHVCYSSKEAIDLLLPLCKTAN
jgi:hypothetical protein